MARYKVKKGSKFWAHDGTNNTYFDNTPENRKFVEDNPEWKLGRLRAFPIMTSIERRQRKKEKLKQSVITGKMGTRTGPEHLFLVTALVEKNTVGVGQVRAEQTRIVWARFYQQALDKVTKHFADMNTEFEQYNVLSSNISVAIR